MLFKTSVSVYAHIDCNSFYASCEVLRNPSLKGKCVCVGDQISIAASYEAKKYGIKVGTPMWEAERILGDRLVRIPPDHAFYSDISKRLMAYMTLRLGKIEIFSIDEFFADITGMSEDYEAFAEELKEEIYRAIGIPVSVGVSNTRLRAKMFGDLHKPFGSFVSFDTPEIEAVFQSLPVRDIPYIGRWSSEKLGARIGSAYDFYALGPLWVQRLLGKNGFTLWLELHGLDVWRPLDHKKRKSIVCTRSFNHEMTDNIHALWRKCLENDERAYDTLLKEKQETRRIGVCLRTRDFQVEWAWTDLGTATIDRSLITKALKELLRKIHKPGTIYRTTGVCYAELSTFTPKQLSLFDRENVTHRENEKLAGALGKLKERYGKSIIARGFVSAPNKWVGLDVLFEVR